MPVYLITLCARPSQVFALFCKYDTAQRGCLTLANVYKMLGEKKSIFGDSLFELIGERANFSLPSKWMYIIDLETRGWTVTP